MAAPREHFEIRRARSEDVPTIVELLADDELGRQRENPGDPAYAAAFTAIDSDPHQMLAVADDGGDIIGCLQLTLIPGLSHRGATRAQVEAVRVRADRRGTGTGGSMLDWAIATAEENGASMIQLTSNASRTRAHAFYGKLGFEATHVGMKRALRPRDRDDATHS